MRSSVHLYVNFECPPDRAMRSGTAATALCCAAWVLLKGAQPWFCIPGMYLRTHNRTLVNRSLHNQLDTLKNLNSTLDCGPSMSFRRAGIPISARMATGYLEANANVLRLLGPFSKTPLSLFSMKLQAMSTMRPRPPCNVHSTEFRQTGLRLSSPTGSQQCEMLTKSPS